MIEQRSRLTRGTSSRRRSFPQPPDWEREYQRSVVTYLTTWGDLVAGETEGGTRCWNRFERGCFGDPKAVAFLVEHGDGELSSGRWVRITSDSVGLRGMCVIDDTPAGALVLESLDSGLLGGFSIAAMPITVREGRQLGPGDFPVFTWTEARLVEAGPVFRPADERALVIEIGDRRPRWQLEAEAVDRDQFLRALWNRPSWA